jgi:hypothetical protein
VKCEIYVRGTHCGYLTACIIFQRVYGAWILVSETLKETGDRDKADVLMLFEVR